MNEETRKLYDGKCIELDLIRQQLSDVDRKVLANLQAVYQLAASRVKLSETGEQVTNAIKDIVSENHIENPPRGVYRNLWDGLEAPIEARTVEEYVVNYFRRLANRMEGSFPTDFDSLGNHGRRA